MEYIKIGDSISILGENSYPTHGTIGFFFKSNNRIYGVTASHLLSEQHNIGRRYVLNPSFWDIIEKMEKNQDKFIEKLIKFKNKTAIYKLNEIILADNIENYTFSLLGNIYRRIPNSDLMVFEVKHRLVSNNYGNTGLPLSLDLTTSANNCVYKKVFKIGQVSNKTNGLIISYVKSGATKCNLFNKSVDADKRIFDYFLIGGLSSDDTAINKGIIKCIKEQSKKELTDSEVRDIFTLLKKNGLITFFTKPGDSGSSISCLDGKILGTLEGGSSKNEYISLIPSNENEIIIITESFRSVGKRCTIVYKDQIFFPITKTSIVPTIHDSYDKLKIKFPDIDLNFSDDEQKRNIKLIQKKYLEEGSTASGTPNSYPGVEGKREDREEKVKTFKYEKELSFIKGMMKDSIHEDIIKKKLLDNDGNVEKIMEELMRHDKGVISTKGIKLSFSDNYSDEKKEEPYEYQDKLNEVKIFVGEKFDNEKAKRLLTKYDGDTHKTAFTLMTGIASGVRKKKKSKRIKKKTKSRSKKTKGRSKKTKGKSKKTKGKRKNKSKRTKGKKKG